MGLPEKNTAMSNWNVTSTTKCLDESAGESGHEACGNVTTLTSVKHGIGD